MELIEYGERHQSLCSAPNQAKWELLVERQTQRGFHPSLLGHAVFFLNENQGPSVISFLLPNGKGLDFIGSNVQCRLSGLGSVLSPFR